MSLLMGICMDMPNFATYKSYKDASADLARKQASKQASISINASTATVSTLVQCFVSFATVLLWGTKRGTKFVNLGQHDTELQTQL